MSLHFEISDEARRKLAKGRRNTTISSLAVSLLAIVVVALILGLFLLPRSPDKVQIVTYASNTRPEETSEVKKVQNTVQRKPSAPSNSPVKAITAMSASPTSIPTVEDVEPVESVQFGAGDDFGSGWGEGAGDGFGGGGKQTAFGRTGGGGLEGRFYDLKNDRNKKINKIGKYFEENAGISGRLKWMVSEYKDLEKRRFTESSLRSFYQASAALSFTSLVMSPSTDAKVAPEAFQVEKEVEPSAWVVVYEGVINPEEPGEYQFLGLFDDVLMVYVNGQLVLDGSFKSYSDLKQTPKKGPEIRKGKPLIEGKYVKLDAGTKLKIIVGESPGGEMGGGLFIREKGKKYKQEGGGDVLPPFTTTPLTSDDIKKLKAIPRVGGKGSFPIEVDDVPVFPAQ